MDFGANKTSIEAMKKEYELVENDLLWLIYFLL